MRIFGSLGTFAMALVLLTGAGVALTTAAASASVANSPHACSGTPTVAASATSHQYVATIKGTASASGTGCTIIAVNIDWGDGGNTQFNGNGGSQLNFTANHTYGSVQTYTVTITGYNSVGQKGTQTLKVAIHGPPYSVMASFDQVDHLPGDRATLYVQVVNTTTGALQSGVTSYYITTCYQNATKACAIVSTIPPHPSTPKNLTSINFTVPPDASIGSVLDVFIEVNASLPTGAYSENGTGSLVVAIPTPPNVCVSSTVNGPSTCSPSTAQFQPGQNFILEISAQLGPGNYPWAGASVAVTFYLNGNQVSASKLGFPTQISTNSLGQASAVVQTAGIGSGDLNITAAVSDPNNANINSQHQTIFVYLQPTPSTQIQVTVSADEYFSGDTLSSHFTITTYSGSPPIGWGASRYFIYGYGPGGVLCPPGSPPQTLAAAPISGVTGSLKYVIPVSFQGVIEVGVSASNATQSVTGVTCALVSPPKLLVQPSEITFNPGDTISVQLTPEGSIFSTASYFAEVSGIGVSGNSVVVYNKSLGTATTFSFTIPSTGTLTAYTLSVVAQNVTGIMAGQDITLTEYSGYALQVSIATPSEYSDGSFKPGDTIGFSYTITSMGLSAPPKFFTMQAYFYNSAQGPTLVQESSPQGTFSMKVPASAGTGTSLVTFFATIPTPTGGFLVQTFVGVLVESNPSILNAEIGAGSGFTVGDILVIAIVAVLATIAFVLWRRRHGGPRQPRVGRRGLFRRKGTGVEQWSQQAPPPQQQVPEGQQYQYPPMPAEEGQPPMPSPTGGEGAPEQPPKQNH